MPVAAPCAKDNPSRPRRASQTESAPAGCAGLTLPGELVILTPCADLIPACGRFDKYG
jgi:hypothetical protein